MAQQKLNKNNIRKITRMGGGGKSVGVTIPITIMRELKWREHQKVVVKKIGKRIIIHNWKERQKKLF